MSTQNSEVPAWAQGLTPEESKPSRSAQPRTDAERIADARSQAIARSKVTNAPGAQYGFGYDESHYQDFNAGPETSRWDAGQLRYIAEILETPILKRSKYAWREHYEPWTGMFNLSDGPSGSIQELKSAVDARIVELGLSKPLIWEWMSVPHPDDDFGRAIWREDLATRIQRFRLREF
jgi:hypothetical protein